MEKNQKLSDAWLCWKSAESKLIQLRGEYEKSLHARAISDDLRLLVKECLEQVGSSLDFAWHALGGTGKYPMRNSLNDFEVTVSQGVPALIAIASAYQPYNTDWVGYFNQILNKHKHVMLVPQVKSVTERVSVQMAGGGSVSWNPSAVQFGSGVFIGGVPVNPNTKMPVPHATQQVMREQWVSFQFDCADFQGLPDRLDVLPLIQQSVHGVKEILEKLENIQ